MLFKRTAFLGCCLSLNMAHSGHATLQLGGFWSDQGKAQHMYIQDLIGNDFTVDKQSPSNGLVGFGYFVDGKQYEHFDLSYGVNAFYLAKTGVAGTVVQESLFSNLGYNYNISNFPLLAVAKANLVRDYPFILTTEVGIGPNFMKVSDFHEYAIDPSTIPDAPLDSLTTATFSAMAGVGIQKTNVFGQVSLELGYKFFYLGEGQFANNTTQLVSTFKTGPVYANALVCGLRV